MEDRELFSIIMLTYDRTGMLREAAESVLGQTYKNLELIIINNASFSATVDVVRGLERRDSRVHVIHFTENQYRGENPAKNMVEVCYNAGLAAARGTYVFYLQDDDVIALDYVEKMVRLFQENPECTSAAGMPVAIDEHSREIVGRFDGKNIRPRYMPGYELVLDYYRGGRMFAAPGTIFTLPTKFLRESGGYHVAVELSQLLGIVPFGVTGFDASARCYWRYHSGQLNRAEAARGELGIRDFFQLFSDWGLEHRWRDTFGDQSARAVKRTIIKRLERTAANWVMVNFLAGRWKAVGKIARDSEYRLGFWLALPPAVYRYVRVNTRVMVSRTCKPAVRWIVSRLPAPVNHFHWVVRLRNRLEVHV